MDCDVLVVGTGIMGMAAAYHLKKNNPEKSVLAVDRYGAPGQGNTGRSNAMFRNTFSSSDNQVLADRSIDFYIHLQSEMKQDIGLQQIGYLWLMNEGKLAASEPYVTSMARNGIETRRYSREELRRLLPELVTDFGSAPDAQLMGLDAVDGALFGPKCGRLAPDRLVRFYESEFLRMGGATSYNTEARRLAYSAVTELDLEGEPFVWQEAEVKAVEATGSISGEIRAKTVVLACGAWANQLLEPAGLDGHIKAKKRQLFSTSADGNDALRRLLHAKGFNGLDLLPMVILPKSGVHFKPVSEEEGFWIACEDDVNRPYIDVPDSDLDSYAAEPAYYERGIHPVLRSYFPCFSAARPRSMWAGLYAYNTTDFLPFAFKEGNLLVVGGDSGSGIMKGDSLGRIVDALYREEDTAMLYGDVPYRTGKIGFAHRDVQREEWTL